MDVTYRLLRSRPTSALGLHLLTIPIPELGAQARVVASWTSGKPIPIQQPALLTFAPTRVCMSALEQLAGITPAMTDIPLHAIRMVAI